MTDPNAVSRTGSPRAPRPCPVCGALMNRHAEKLLAPTTSEEFAAFDATLFGVLEEFHLCPNCGHAESRRVAG
jgi:ribosomal protein S27AE